MKQPFFKGTRPVDQLMLIIEFLILVFIVWEFGWKVKDWYQDKQRKRQREDEMTKKLSHLAPEKAEALRHLVLEGKQPPGDIAASLQAKLHPIVGRDFVGWFIDVEYRDYMQRWAKEKASSSR